MAAKAGTSAKTKSSSAKISGNALKESALESARLREVLNNFSSADRPAHVVAAVAIFRADKILTVKMRAALAPYSLTPERYELLGVLQHASGGRMSLKNLGLATLLHPATTTYTVDALEERGFVKRTPDPKDRRGVLAQITPAGRDIVRRCVKALEHIDWGMAELNTEDAAMVAQILSRLEPSHSSQSAKG